MNRRFLTVLLLSVLSSSALGDSIPNTPYEGAAYFNSKKSDVLQIDLELNSRSGVLAQIRVPRAYVNFADGYLQSEHPELPSMIRTDQAMISLRLSKMTPYVLEWPSELRPTRDQRDTVRRDTAFVRLYARGRRASSVLDLPPDRFETGPSFEGLSARRLKGSPPDLIEYTDPSKREPFLSISCMSSNKPLAYCRYSFLVCPSLSAHADMVDLRYNGGVKEARRRVEALASKLRTWAVCK